MVKGVSEFIEGIKQDERKEKFGTSDYDSILNRAKLEDRPALQADIDAFEKQLALDTGLFTASSADEVNKLIAEGANCRYTFHRSHRNTEDWFNALNVQAITGNKESIAALIAAGAVQRHSRVFGSGTPLHTAFLSQNIDAAEALASSQQGFNAHEVCAAILYGVPADEARGMALLDHMLERANPEKLDQNAIYVDDRSLVTAVQGSALAAAVHANRPDILEKLLKAEVKPESGGLAEALAKQKDPETIPVMMEMLRAHGFDLQTQNRMDDELILTAAAAGNRPLVQWLQEADVTVDMQKLNRAGEDKSAGYGARQYNLLQRAQATDNHEAAELLRELGAKNPSISAARQMFGRVKEAVGFGRSAN